MDDGLEFLSKVYTILHEEKVFDTKASSEGDIIKFKFPDELRVRD